MYVIRMNLKISLKNIRRDANEHKYDLIIIKVYPMLASFKKKKTIHYNKKLYFLFIGNFPIFDL